MNNLIKFIQKETKKLHKITLIQEGREISATNLEKLKAQRSGSSETKREIAKAVTEIKKLGERDVDIFYSFRSDSKRAIKEILNNIKLYLPTFYELFPEIFNENQDGTTIIVDNVFAIIPVFFKQLLFFDQDDYPTLNLTSIKKGLMSLLLKKLRNYKN